jgi:hydrogenase 3 maturation protease
MSTSSVGLVVLGVGNRLKGDDGAGPYVVDLLDSTTQAGSQRAASVRGPAALDCGTIPENYTSVLRRLRPGHVVIVDAADMGLAPGSVRIVPKERAGALGLSTHSMPLSLFMDYIGGLCGTVTLIGIQPLSMRLGDGVSQPVRSAALWLAGVFRDGRLSDILLLDEGATA